MEKILVDFGSSTTEIIIGENILAELIKYLSNHSLGSNVCIVTDDNLSKLYKDNIIDLLKKAGYHSCFLSIVPGEDSKTFDTVITILSCMSDNFMTKNDTVIGIGGGVVGDIAGFCASIYHRGVNYVSVATSLVAMIDSSIGGKTGINGFGSKNQIGTIYQPKLVIIDLNFLATLPEIELHNGYGELIKYGYLCDDLFHNITMSVPSMAALLDIIPKCVKYKLSIVVQDEADNNIRQILNFGHTVGHGIENKLPYKYSHGEGIAIGMLAAIYLSSKLGYLGESFVDKYLKIMKLYDFKMGLSLLDNDNIINSMKMDKKNRSELISFVLLKNDGDKLAPFVVQVCDVYILDALDYIKELR